MAAHTLPLPMPLPRLLPVPGPVWGACPQRPAEDRAPPWRSPWVWRAWRPGPQERPGGTFPALPMRSAAAQARRVARVAAAEAAAFAALPAPARARALAALRRALREQGLVPALAARALGAAAQAAEATLGWAARQTQLRAAAALLDDRFAEMATGEGKTLALALAAAAAALAGVPVHVVTANAYLAGRDAARLAPMYAALGLRAGALAGDDAAHRAAYRHDVLYATAQALAFDFLRDRADAAAAAGAAGAAGDAAAGAPPRQRGLCMALLDEADSILLDEAEVPLILSRSAPQAARRAFLWQALALARRLRPGVDCTLLPAERLALLTPAGEQHAEQLTRGLGGPWQRARYRREALQTALVALHLVHRQRHYVVREGRVDLIDEVSARIAEGRVWSRGLHTLVAMKEGLAPPPETETVTQVTFQRFFQRYWRLAGLSGTLWEARHELARVHGRGVLRIPLHLPSRRTTLPTRRVAAAALADEAVARIGALAAAGRPVLVGVDSVAAARALSASLQAAGLPHRVLDALNDAEEAAIVAGAGRAGAITVATRMAGRGTDIVLDDAARAAGGLHVLNLQHNPSARLDRQLAGRAGRHGDPGSSETWVLAGPGASDAAPAADKDEPWNTLPRPAGPPGLALLMRRWQQWREERRRAAVRERLLEQDLLWERRLSFAGRER